MPKNPELSSLDIVEPLIPVLSAYSHVAEVQFMGGIGSAALTMAEAQILPDDRLIVVPESDELRQKVSQYRPDGTLRDLDCLVLSADPTKIELVESVAKDVIEDQLILSFFGLHTAQELAEQHRHPVRSLARVWVSDRYVPAVATPSQGIQKALFPFEVSVPKEALETWHVWVGDRQPMPVPSPATSALNYVTRSLSGLRPKDAKKFGELMHTIETKAPELIDWMVDGPGASQVQLARIFHTLREPVKDPKDFKLSRKYEASVLSEDELLESIQIPGLSERRKTIALAASIFKARSVYAYESNPTLVTFWQKHIEARIDTILKNKS